MHMEEPLCAQCHRKIDPVGYGLENFDAVGRWRSTELTEVLKKGRTVVKLKHHRTDPSGALPNGPFFPMPFLGYPPRDLAMKSSLVLLFMLSVSHVLADESVDVLKPILAIPGVVVLDHDFAIDGPVEREDWAKRQGTRWTIKDGVLQGQPSSEEYQAKKDHHKGLEARTNIPKTPPEFIVKFSVRFVGGEETSVVPFVEFGHHVVRLKFSRDGGAVLADHESLKALVSTHLELGF